VVRAPARAFTSPGTLSLPPAGGGGVAFPHRAPVVTRRPGVGTRRSRRRGVSSALGRRQLGRPHPVRHRAGHGPCPGRRAARVANGHSAVTARGEAHLVPSPPATRTVGRRPGGPAPMRGSWPGWPDRSPRPGPDPPLCCSERAGSGGSGSADVPKAEASLNSPTTSSFASTAGG